MAFIPALNTVQAELVYNWNGQICENVLQFEALGAISIPEMQELGAHLVNWWDTSMQPQIAPACSLTNIKLTDLTAAFAPAIDYATGLPLAGLGPGESMPNNVSLAITKRTVFRGRSFRGRIFQVGLTEGMVNGNNVLSLNRDAIVAAWQLLKAFTTVGESWTMVVMSRYQNLLPRAIAETTPVTNFTTDGIVDSQRRRLPGRGS